MKKLYININQCNNSYICIEEVFFMLSLNDLALILLRFRFRRFFRRRFRFC